MTMHYRRTQFGYLSLAVTGAAIIWMVGAALRLEQPVLWIAIVVFTVLGWVFSSLTIEIRDGELRHYFGPGVWKRQIPVRDIRSASVVPSRWWEGWGIRFTPRGMLYNVSGFGAVEIVRRGDAPFRLGSDEPDRLRDALHAAMAHACVAEPDESGDSRASSDEFPDPLP